MVSQGVKGIAITPTSAAVAPALDEAIAQGVKVVLMDNDLPDWDGKSSVVATDNHRPAACSPGEWLAGKLKDGDTHRGARGRRRASRRSTTGSTA